VRTEADASQGGVEVPGLAESLELSEVYGMSMLSRVYTRWSVSRVVCCEQMDITEDETKDRGRLNEEYSMACLLMPAQIDLKKN